MTGPLLVKLTVDVINIYLDTRTCWHKASSSTHGFPVYDNSAVAHWQPLHLAAEGRWRIADGGWRVEPQPHPACVRAKLGNLQQAAAI